MTAFYKTLGGKSLQDLPKVPSNLVVTTGSLGGNIVYNWTNNNTLTGCTNIPQYFYNGVWYDGTPVASSATTTTIGNLFDLQFYETRVSVYHTATSRYYSSLVKPFTTIANPFPLSGLISRFQFENNLTDSVNGYNFSNAGGSYVAGKVGDCYVFPGYAITYNSNTGYIGVFTGTSAYSISLWVKIGDSYTTSNIMSYGGCGVSHAYGTATREVYYKNRASGTESLIDYLSWSTWFHVAITFDGSETKTYFNGAYKTTITESDSLTVPEIKLGNVYDNNGMGIDQLYTYNRALTASEVAILYNNGNGI